MDNSLVPWNNYGLLYKLLPKDVQKDKATWSLKVIRFHINKAKLKITLIQMFKTGT